MKCPYCLEEIIDGALVCRFCGKKQPLAGEARKARTQRKWLIGVSAVGVFVVVIMAWAGADYDNRMQRLRAAAVCNGTLTAEQLEAAADGAAAKGGGSIQDAQDSVIAFACPSMAK